MSMQKPEPMDTKRCLFFSYHIDATKPERDENYVCSSDITETMQLEIPYWVEPMA